MSEAEPSKPGQDPGHDPGQNNNELVDDGPDSPIPEMIALLDDEMSMMMETELSNRRLMSLGTDLLRMQSVLDGYQLRIAATLETRAACVQETGLKTTGWFALHGNMSRTEAKHRVQTANKLQRIMPNVVDAVTDGRLSFEHAKIMARATNSRIEQEMAQASEFFIKAAENQSVDAWRRDVQAFAELVDEDGGYDPNRDIERNKLRCRASGSSIKITGELHGEIAQTAQQALNRMADEMFRKFTNDREVESSLEVPPRSTLMALGFVELCRRGRAVDLFASKGPKPDVTVVVQAHDASKVHSPDGVELSKDKVPRKRPNVGPSPALLQELSKYAWFDPDDFNSNGHGGDAVSGADSSDVIEHYLVCDPVLRPVVVDSLGTPLDAGRTIRLATPTQRHALSVRDFGCIWPGCDDPPHWCDAHHVVPWQQGGPTDLANLASLCRHHHVVTHLPGWKMFIHESTNEYAWETPSGRILHAQRNEPADVAGLASEVAQQVADTRAERRAELHKNQDHPSGNHDQSSSNQGQPSSSQTQPRENWTSSSQPVTNSHGDLDSPSNLNERSTTAQGDVNPFERDPIETNLIEPNLIGTNSNEPDEPDAA